MTPETMEWILSQNPPHPGFGFKVRENQWGVWLVVALEEFAKFSGGQQEDLAAFIGGICNTLRQRNIPCYIHRVDSLTDDEQEVQI
jgi:hypothetical protein